jgi:hypothetical protein
MNCYVSRALLNSRFQIPNFRFNIQVWNLDPYLEWNLKSGIWNLTKTGVAHMKYKRFEDLPVWNTAIDLAVSIYALTSKSEFAPHHGFRDQLERAAVSVSNNIA